MVCDIRTVRIVTLDRRTVMLFNAEYAVAADTRQGSDKDNVLQVSIGGRVDSFTNVISFEVTFSDGDYVTMYANDPDKGDFSLR